ncbi:MAG: helix-turn-helix domain-containing protein [Aeromicrobium sp.]
MQTLVSTDHIDESDRFDFWVDEISRMMLLSLDTRPGPPHTFFGVARGCDLGDLQLNVLDAGPMQVAHGFHPSHRDDGDQYKLVLQVSGTAMVEHDGVESTLTAGDMVLCDTSRPYTFTYDAAFRTAMVLLPRTAIPLQPSALRTLTGRRIAAQTGTGQTVAALVTSLTSQTGAVSDTAAGRLADGTKSMITALLAEQLTEIAPLMSSPAIMVRAREHIERHLSDEELSPDAIAEALGISRRYLFKLFADEGTTVSAWIRKRRLERCALDLVDPVTKHQQIGLIAARWGLVDGRHFSRLFRAEYACTPREYRGQALGA